MRKGRANSKKIKGRKEQKQWKQRNAGGWENSSNRNQSEPRQKLQEEKIVTFSTLGMFFFPQGDSQTLGDFMQVDDYKMHF